MTTAVVNVATLEIVRRYTDEESLVVWPNGDATHAPSVGDERGGYRYVSLTYTGDAPNEFYTVGGSIPQLGQTTLSYAQTWAPKPLPDVQAVLSARVDDQAEAVRLKYITPGSGQAMIYLRKAEEALAYVADAKPDPANYPLLAAGVTETVTLADVAADVNAKARQWLAIGSAIEKARLDGKNAIAAAQTVDDAVAAYNAIVWGAG